MGGRQYNLPRLPRAAYLQVETQVRAVLGDLIPGRYRIPRVMPDKADFGDLDLLVDSSVMEKGFFAGFAARLGALEHRKVGSVQSFHVPVQDTGLQVDLFSTPPGLLDMRQSFMDYGDLGDILRQVVRPYGVLWNDSGLSVIYRRSGEAHSRHLMNVSGGIDTVLELIGLNAEPLRRGFDAEVEMHRWLTSARDFRSRAFLDPDGAAHQRSKHRPGMARFRAYLEAEIQAGRLQTGNRMEQQDIQVLLGRLPQDVAANLREQWDEQVRLENRAEKLTERFNGTLLRDLRSDLEQMEFKLTFGQVKNLPEDAVPGGQNWMLERSPDEVRAYLLTLQGVSVIPQMRQSWENKAETEEKRAAKKKAAQNQAQKAWELD